MARAQASRRRLRLGSVLLAVGVLLTLAYHVYASHQPSNNGANIGAGLTLLLVYAADVVGLAIVAAELVRQRRGRRGSRR